MVADLSIVGAYETEVGPDFDWIVTTYYDRSNRRGPVFQQMKAVRDAYNGDIVIPLPEMDRSERATVANLVQTGLDETARRIAGVLPMLDYPALDPTKKRSTERADLRRKANLGWWEANNVAMQLRLRARWLIGYSMAPVMLRPDPRLRIPTWQVRDPMGTFPADTLDPTDVAPRDTIFTYTRTHGWLRDNYPAHYPSLLRYENCGKDELLTMIEYVDNEVVVVGVLGEQAGPSVINRGEAGRGRPDTPGGLASTGGSVPMNIGRARLIGQHSRLELERIPNRAGICTAVVPGSITLDRPMGQFDGSIPLLHMQARLQALDVIATEKAIFPDAWLVSRPQEVAEIIHGPVDGRTGEVNIVKGGDIEYKNGNPGPASNLTIDRLERNLRVSSGISPEFGGESASNIRTGRRGDSVRSEQLDHGLQENQEILARSLQHENKVAVAIAKAYFGREKKSFYVKWKGSTGQVDYVANEVFETDNNTVTFPYAGSDANAISINALQKQGAGIISKQSVRELDPTIADPAREEKQVVAEQLDQAILQGVLQQAASGEMTPMDAAALKRRVMLGDSIEEAIDWVHRQAQLRQASAGAVGAPDGPVLPGSPEAQPGLALPGSGQEQPTIQPPGPGTSNLAQLLQTLRAPSPATQGYSRTGG